MPLFPNGFCGSTGHKLTILNDTQSSHVVKYICTFTLLYTQDAFAVSLACGDYSTQTQGLLALADLYRVTGDFQVCLCFSCPRYLHDCYI
jgi:hypothetical protein